MINKIKEILNVGVTKKDFAGAQFCLVIDGKIKCEEVGFLDYSNKVPVNKNTLYDVASLSKVIVTTTLVFKLIEDDKLAFDTPVKEILSNFKHKDILVKDLLTHSSGLPADIKRASTLKTKDEVIKKAYEAEVIYEKGSRVVYSDIGFIILGLLIEEITKKPLNVVADEMIFKPLKMTHSTYRPQGDNIAPTEERNDDVYKGLLKGLVHDEKSFAMEGLSGHAGLFSTANDIAIFIEGILNSNFVLNYTSISKLFPVRVSYIDSSGNEYYRSLGYQKPSKGSYFGDDYDFKNTIGHTGFTGCNLIIDRHKKIGFVLLSNAVHPDRKLNKIFSYRRKVGNVLFP